MVTDEEVASNIESQPDMSEKMFNAHQVEDIVKREKFRAAEQARLKAEAKHKEELDKLQGSQSQGGQQIDENAIQDKIYDRFLDDLKQHQEQLEIDNEKGRLKKIADQYYLKMGKGSELFSDFNEVIKGFDASAFPNAVLAAAEMDDTPEVMYELVNNPSKLQLIDSLAQRSPELAKKELQRISSSIKQNLEAKQNHASAPAPLSRPKSSTVGADNGKMTLKDYKNAPWLRG